MSTLSIFIDESGDNETTSKYYLLTLVFHDQARSIEEPLAKYRQALSDKQFDDIPQHLNPLMRGNKDYATKDIETRKGYLHCFAVLVDHTPFTYYTLAYRKNEVASQLEERMKRDLILLFFRNLQYFQTFDKVKIYYDNGQNVVSAALRGAVSYALSKEAILFENANPPDYALLQVADYVCGLELAALKYSHNEQTATDVAFFGDRRSFKKNWLKKLRRKQLA